MRETGKPRLFVASRMGTRWEQKQMGTDVALACQHMWNTYNFYAIQFYSVGHSVAKWRKKSQQFHLTGVHNLVSFILPKYKPKPLFKLSLLIFPLMYCLIWPNLTSCLHAFAHAVSSASRDLFPFLHIKHFISSLQPSSNILSPMKCSLIYPTLNSLWVPKIH